MPTVVTTPNRLTWANFVPGPAKILDPGDGTLVDALTEFDYHLQDLTSYSANGIFTVPSELVITITPRCKVWTGVTRTDKLLLHEHFHYDVGTMCARALARHLKTLWATDRATLAMHVEAATKLHFKMRADVIQKQYDIATGHGTDSAQQHIWTWRMYSALANPDAAQICGYLF